MNFDVYPETMPDATGTNWAVEGGNLFCFNFAINSDQPLPEHYEQAREKIVKFCYRAIKKLGNPPREHLVVDGAGRGERHRRSGKKQRAGTATCADVG